MDIANWLKEQSGQAYEYAHDLAVIPVSDLKELLKTHSIVPVDQWVSVEDRLPSIADPVLTIDSAGDQWVDQVNGKGRFGTDQGDWVVTHWMPLPEPPKAAGQGEQAV